MTEHRYSGHRFCILYRCDRKERRTAWFSSWERAKRALDIIEARHGERNTTIYVD